MWIKTSVAALGIVGALAAAIPAPTLAQPQRPPRSPGRTLGPG